MHFLYFLYPTLFAILSLSPAVDGAKPKNAILLSQVKSLTLHDNAKTSHRRVSAIPQLACKGPGCRYYKVDVMRCTNQGSEYSEEDISWSCKATVPEEFKLGSTEVICEGYANSNDEYVLKGSCGVEYRLLLTEKGEEKYGKSKGWGGDRADREDNGGWYSFLFLLLVIGFIAYILYLGWNDPDRVGRLPRRGNRWRGGWNGGGGDDPWDPPPPYPGKRYGYGGVQQGWRPGFWTGAAAGGATGYLAGSRGRQNQPQPSTGGGWFGGGNGGSASRPSSSSSSARYETTGFGSTARR
ncbi:hypothetical protein B7494_g5798 [Chlorociboria aeruginascens]|nr:hypothetical protein B7494_g5798 [Chlorociboria aeruginascens]